MNAMQDVYEASDALSNKIGALGKYQGQLDEVCAKLAVQNSDMSGRLKAPGTFTPGRLTNGPVTGTELTVIDGPFTPQPFQVINNKRFTGQVDRKTVPGVIWNNCEFTANAPRLVKCFEPVTVPWRFNDCRFRPASPSVDVQECIGGRDFELYRPDISGAIDGVAVRGSNVILISPWIHDLFWSAVDPEQGGTPTHNDAVQIGYGQTASGIWIIGGLFELGPKTNSGVMLTGTVNDFLLRDTKCISSSTAEPCGSAVNFGAAGSYTNARLERVDVSARGTWKSGPVVTNGKTGITQTLTRYMDGTAA